MNVADLKLLWINVSLGGPDGISRVPFERFFTLTEIDVAELESADSAGHWDAVCFNFDYPSMSGLKLIPEVKSRWPSAPILLLTLQNSAELSLWALRSRVFDLLVKPAVAGEVDRMLARVVGALHARNSQKERKPQVVIAQLPTESRYRPTETGAARLQAAVTYVAKHYLRPISGSEVATLCSMSPSRFCREFKALFNVTFVEYLADYRMEQAKRLLANPSISVGDVAVAVGFSDPSYFTRVFKRQEGIAPSEYRANTIFELAHRPTGSD